MFGRWILIFVLVPLIELTLLSELLRRTDLPTTIAVVFITGATGISLTRRQGNQAWRAIQRQLASGQSPSREILDGVMILLAGAFLITPGLLTDGVGLLLLVPQIRRWLGVRIAAWLKKRTAAGLQAQMWQARATNRWPPDTAEDGDGPSVRVVDPVSAVPPLDE